VLFLFSASADLLCSTAFAFPPGMASAHCLSPQPVFAINLVLAIFLALYSAVPFCLAFWASVSLFAFIFDFALCFRSLHSAHLHLANSPCR
jgi:hypothetical protein